MQLPLPSGAWVEVREHLKAKDKFRVQDAVRISTDGVMSGGIMTLIETTLMARLIEGWSLPQPLPGAHTCPECVGDTVKWHEHVADEIGEAFSLEDYNSLEGWISPYLEAVMQAPNLGTSSGSAASS